MKVKIHHEGTNIILTILLILVIINGILFTYAAAWVWITVLVISLILMGLIINFFRLPHRHFSSQSPLDVVASVDGTVVACEEVMENEVLHEKVLQISIFMSIFNVHANWTPVQGVVEMVKHHAGRFMAAYLPKSSTENERSTIVIRAVNGDRILMRKIAGAIARRIVTYPEVGEDVNFDDHIGFIKFGSRVDVYLPLDSEVFVKLGDKTWGGETPIARLKERSKKDENPEINQE